MKQEKIKVYTALLAVSKDDFDTERVRVVKLSSHKKAIKELEKELFIEKSVNVLDNNTITKTLKEIDEEIKQVKERVNGNQNEIENLCDYCKECKRTKKREACDYHTVNQVSFEFEKIGLEKAKQILEKNLDVKGNRE